MLRNSELYYYKDPNDAEAKGSINLGGVMIKQLNQREAKEEVDKKFVIKVIQQQRTWYLSSETQQDIMEWGFVLKKASYNFVGRELHVDPQNTKKKDLQYKSINEALSYSEAQDRIIIHKGEYKEEIVVKKPLSFESDGEVTLLSNKRPCVTVNFFGCCQFKKINFIQNSPTGDFDGVMMKQGNAHFENCIIGIFKFFIPRE